jgi:hypothetical protein
MLVSKVFPGRYNTPYVAGMNVTNLPTNTFSVSNSIADAAYLDSSASTEPLGTREYTLIMWCPVMTAFNGTDSSVTIP